MSYSMLVTVFRYFIPLLQEHDRTEDKTTYGSHMRIQGKKLSLYVTLVSQHKLPAAVFEAGSYVRPCTLYEH